MWNTFVSNTAFASVSLLLFLAHPATAQDIAVSGETYELIPDGSPASLSLGTVYHPISVAGTASGMFFEIHNTHPSESLIISSITNAGPHAGDFTIGGLGSTTVPAGETVDFGVVCNPSAVGERIAVISINSNDPDAESVYTFGLSCLAYESDLEIDPQATINIGLLDEPKAKTNKAGTTSFKAKVHVGNVGWNDVTDPVLRVYWSDLPYLTPSDLAYEKQLKPLRAFKLIADFKRKNVKVKLKVPDQSAYVFARIVSAGSVSEFYLGDNTIRMPFGDH